MSDKKELEWMPLQTFGSLEDAQVLTKILEENEIHFDVLQDSNSSGDPLGLDFQNRGADSVIVQVPVNDIERARRILEISAGDGNSIEITADDYLASFGEEELLDILKAPDEWNQVDYAVALRLLKEMHGKEFTEEELQKFHDDRIKELETPLSAGTSNQMMGLIAGTLSIALGIASFFSLTNNHFLYVLMLCFLVSCLTVISGWNWSFRRKRLPDGRKIFVYDTKGRLWGRIVLIGGLLALVISIVAVLIRTV
jgi:hypothetical protein